MFKSIITSIRATLILTFVTCVAYPLVVTVVAQLCFHEQANGSLIMRHDTPVGSALLAQKFTSPRYFWPRPSVSDFVTSGSGASNLSYTSKKLVDLIAERRNFLGQNAPSDLITASASGLDPHISPEAARFQIERVANARGISLEKMNRLVETAIEQPQFGFLGGSRVNVLLLNCALDEIK